MHAPREAEKRAHLSRGHIGNECYGYGTAKDRFERRSWQGNGGELFDMRVRLNIMFARIAGTPKKYDGNSG